MAKVSNNTASPRSALSDQATQRKLHFDVCMAAVLIILTSPVLGVITLLSLVLSGRPILYRGKRLGKDKKFFTMYKFRTLVPNAQGKLGSRLVNDEEELVTPLGKFLRPTRLDELPQLFNVVWGEMQLIGPRPVRPEVYRDVCQKIPGYDVHFAVRPGIIGPAQLFTPHGCPKIVRTIIDNRFIRGKRSVGRTCYFLVLTGWIVIKKAVMQITTVVLSRRGDNEVEIERRKRQRSRPENTRLYLCEVTGSDTYRFLGRVVDISSDTLRINCSQLLQKPLSGLAKLEIDLEARDSEPDNTRYAFVDCRHIRCRQVDDDYHYVYRYRPVSPVGYFVIHQYFMGESFAGYK